MIIQIPYQLIGEIIALTLFILAFIEAEIKGRIFLVSVFVLLFLLPWLFPSRIMSLLSLITKLAVGMGCYIFLKYRGYFRR
jgi:hypothetical protein